MKVMLEEIERKKTEAELARAEEQRRREEHRRREDREAAGATRTHDPPQG
jgi:hypothetical protein